MHKLYFQCICCQDELMNTMLPHQHMLRFDWIPLFKQYLRYNPVIRCVIYYAFGLSAKVGQKCMLLMQRVISSAVLYNKNTRNVSSHNFCCLLKQLNIFAESKPSASTIFEFWAPWKYRRKNENVKYVDVYMFFFLIYG